MTQSASVPQQDPTREILSWIDDQVRKLSPAQVIAEELQRFGYDPRQFGLAPVVQQIAPAPAAPLAPEPFAHLAQHELSPTQVSNFAECERKWAWEKLDGIEVPQKNSAKVGERVHAILEAWLQFATPPDQTEELVLIDERTNQPVTYYPGKVAAAGLHHLPPPGPHLEIERWIRPPLLTVPNTFWNGRVDCAHELLGDPELIDHKTTTDLKWAKTPEVLRTDAQALIYAWAAMHATGKHFAHLRWIYYQSRKPFKTYVSYTKMGRDETLEALGPWEDRARRMISLKVAGKRALDLEPNPDACERFGGCPHRLRCGLSPQQLMRSVFAMDNLSLEARIDAAARAAGQAQAPAYPGGFAGQPQLQGYAQPGPQTAMPYAQPQPQPQQYVQPQPQPQQYVQPQQMQMPQVPQGAPVQFAQSAPALEARPQYPTPWQPHATAPGWEARQVLDAQGQVQWEQRPVQVQMAQPPAQAQGQVAAHQGLNPPEVSHQPLQATVPQQQATETDDSKVGDQFDGMNAEGLKAFAAQHGLVVPPRLREKNLRVAVRNAFRDKQSGAIAPQPAQPQQIPQQMQPAQPQQPAQNIPQAIAQAVTQAVPGAAVYMPQQPAPVVQQPAAPVAHPVAQRRAFSLFVNCVPQKTGKRVLTLVEAFGDCFSFVAQNANVPDYRMVEHYQGAPRVCVQIRSKQNAAPLGDDAIVVISTLSQEGKDVYGTLAELAGEVVVGSAA